MPRQRASASSLGLTSTEPSGHTASSLQVPYWASRAAASGSWAASTRWYG